MLGSYNSSCLAMERIMLMMMLVLWRYQTQPQHRMFILYNRTHLAIFGLLAGMWQLVSKRNPSLGIGITTDNKIRMISTPLSFHIYRCPSRPLAVVLSARLNSGSQEKHAILTAGSGLVYSVYSTHWDICLVPNCFVELRCKAVNSLSKFLSCEMALGFASH